SHYSSTLDFSNEALSAAEKGYKKIVNALSALNVLSHEPGNETDSTLEKDLLRLSDECYKNMSDDFNTAKTLAVLFEMAARINDFKSGNTSLNKVGKDVFEQFKTTYQAFVRDVLGLREENEQNNDLLDGTIKILIELRKKARLDKNFALSDKIRDDLKQVGVQLKDGKDGTIDYVIE
ncbi:MAG TPA: cysteine--tRNA ligase, partial [Cyclobacteriaceae bacterium]|nr:cysteine--tRNA ligase [Cyclobacteriaceae bacterium]